MYKYNKKVHATSKVDEDVMKNEDSDSEENTAIISSDQQPTEHDIVRNDLVSKDCKLCCINTV